MSTPSPARARAESVFRAPTLDLNLRPVDANSDGMSEYRAKQVAELEKMAKLRAMRMAKGKR
jgi:hypothetical protein